MTRPEVLAWTFQRRCAPFAPETERPFIPATNRLAWAVQDTQAWSFNPREVKELYALIETLLDEVLAAQSRSGAVTGAA